jgi:NADH dehydrogenase (ubiquinone) Fe-S protein 1
MMRPQLFRAAARFLRVPKVTPRAFATTAPRAAEVELTIGKSNLGLLNQN